MIDHNNLTNVFFLQWRSFSQKTSVANFLCQPYIYKYIYNVCINSMIVFCPSEKMNLTVKQILRRTQMLKQFQNVAMASHIQKVRHSVFREYGIKLTLYGTLQLGILMCYKAIINILQCIKNPTRGLCFCKQSLSYGQSTFEDLT